MTGWIWHVRGTLNLAPERSGNEAFDRLSPLFETRGTTYQRTGDVLRFQKKDQAAQDKMSIFDGGVLRIERDPGGTALRYCLKSKALLLCFLAPLMFLAFAGLTIEVGRLETPAAAAKKADKPEPKKPEVPMNPIDKALGMPAPDKPKKDAHEEPKKPSPTPAYVFAVIFAVLYLVGRILEQYLVRNLFAKALARPA